MPFLDAETTRQLGLDAIWARIKPESSLGRTRLRKIEAFRPEEWSELENELDRLEHLSTLLRDDAKKADNLRFLLGSVRDISGSLQRSTQRVTLDDMEFYEIKKLLAIVEKIHSELVTLGWTFCLDTPLDLCEECREALGRGQGGHTSFYVADAYDEKLAQIRTERVRLESVLATFRASVDSVLVRTAGRVLSMDGDITVSTSDQEVIAALDDIAELCRKQETATFVTFYLREDERIQDVKSRLSQVREEEEERKQQVRIELSAFVATFAPRLLTTLDQLSYLDVLLAKATFANEIDGIRPQLSEGARMRIVEGRHLLVEEEVRQAGHDYTPLSLEISRGVTLITGPNMGGKTVSLKTIGLLTAMAQYGLLVPARFMEFQPRQFIRAHLAEATIPKGLSAYAGEVVFLRDVIGRSDESGLILVDEIAHGTNPVEGAGVAQAVIEHLSQKQTMTVITTHYPSLARCEGVYHLRVKGLDPDCLKKVQASSLQRCMDYRLEEAEPSKPLRSDAAAVAEALGLESTIVQRAKELLAPSTTEEKRDPTNG